MQPRHARNPSAVMRPVAYYFVLTAAFGASPTPTSETRTPGERDRGLYHHCISCIAGLAHLYTKAGSRVAAVLLSSVYSVLLFIRLSTSTVQADGGIAGWRRDRDFARKYFGRARALDPDLETTVVPPKTGDELGSGVEWLMPSIEIKDFCSSYPAF